MRICEENNQELFSTFELAAYTNQELGFLDVFAIRSYLIICEENNQESALLLLAAEATSEFVRKTIKIFFVGM